MKRLIVTSITACVCWGGLSLSGATLGKAEKVTPLPRALFFHKALSVGNYIYTFGGHGSGRRLADVFSVEVKEDGTLAKWRKETPLPAGNCGFMGVGAAAHNGFVYLVGGGFMNETTGKKGDKTNVVIFSKIGENGRLGVWKETSPLPQARKNGAAIIIDERIYYIGGEYNRNIFSAPINADGTLGEWSDAGRMISNRFLMSLFYNKPYLYVVGGGVIHNKQSATVFKAKIRKNGGIMKWRRTEPLPVPLFSYGGVKVKNNIFIFGGGEPQSDAIYTNTIEDDGHFGDWMELGKLPYAQGITALQAVYARGFIYVIGGITMKTGEMSANRVWRKVYRYKIQK